MHKRVDIRSLLLGAVCGGLGFAALSWILDPSSPIEPAGSQSDRTTIPPILEPPRSTTGNSSNGDTTQPQATVPAAAAAESGLDTAQGQTAPDTDVARSIPVSVFHRKLFGDGTPNGFVRRHAALEAEPKDESWAYHMEQAILQFLADQPLMPEFDISLIECRTTFCHIHVVGYDMSTRWKWDKVMNDMRESVPWSSFSESIPSVIHWGAIDGRFAVVQTIERRDASLPHLEPEP